ncbi:MAG: aldo/keto reductase [Planctomycetes bacterium]|nr:aldo/keto reductase [Planctomycetota bacterium]
MNRREFVQTVAGSVLAAHALPALAGEAPAAKPSATDRVTLGKTKVRPTRLGVGTGSVGGSVQRALGQEGLAKLVRHAWDRGIRYIDTAGNYGTHGMLKAAIQGLPREELVLLTKVWLGKSLDVPKTLEQFRQELGTDYFDVTLLHCVMKPTWPEDFKKHRDDLSAAKEKGIVRAVGVSTHGMPGLQQIAGCDWVEVALLRMNHNGAHMDGATGQWAEKVGHEAAVAEIKKIKAAGKGVLGMKLCGNGDYKDPEDRRKAVQFVFGNKLADAVTIGCKSPAEVDEALENIARALNA